jgi:hypothetical protein
VELSLTVQEFRLSLQFSSATGDVRKTTEIANDISKYVLVLSRSLAAAPATELPIVETA